MTKYTIKCMIRGCESDGNRIGIIQLPKELEVELALCHDHHKLIVKGEEPMVVWTEGRVDEEV